ncbi:MAG: hypothetical protein IJ853_01825 [Rickettsiales bacterium]|nr:hypothetical protein [Rickettsiales bacterium]
METAEKDTLQSFINYLMERGYPENSLLTNYKIGKYRADLVIIDPETNNPLQIFEFKAKKTQQSQLNGKNRIKNYIFELSKVNPDAIGYLIFTSDAEPYFEIIDPNTEKSVLPSAFDYNNLVRKGKNAKEIMLNSNKSKAVGNLKFVTLSLVVVIFVILVFDILGIVEMNGHRLYLILMIMILILLPYYETIKVANFELTQKK